VDGKINGAGRSRPVAGTSSHGNGAPDDRELPGPWLTARCDPELSPNRTWVTHGSHRYGGTAWNCLRL